MKLLLKNLLGCSFYSVVLLLQVRLAIAEDKSLDTFADEIKKTEALLLELDRHEKDLVKGTNAVNENKPKNNNFEETERLKNKIIELESQNRALVASMSIKSDEKKILPQSDKQTIFLKKILEENQELNSHKERLVEEIIKYRKQIKDYRSTLEQALEREHRLMGKIKATNSDLIEGERRISELTRMNSEVQDLKKDKEILRVQLAKAQESIAKLEEVLEGKRAAEADNNLRENLQKAQEKLEQHKAIAQSKEDELTSLKSKIADLTTTVDSMQGELAEKEQLAKEVLKLKKSILVMKTDLELKHSQMQSLISGGPGKVIAPPVEKSANKVDKRTARKESQQDTISSDVVIAEVIAHKVNLRSGPGDEHSPLMQIMRGAQLVVEDKKGDWYRVISPTGSRAYIRTNVVRLKAGGKTSGRVNQETPSRPQSKPARENNYDDLKIEEDSPEDEADAAFRQLRRGVLRDE